MLNVLFQHIARYILLCQTRTSLFDYTERVFILQQKTIGTAYTPNADHTHSRNRGHLLMNYTNQHIKKGIV